MRAQIILAALAATAAVTPISGQTVIETDKSTIELIGLHRWTLQMIEDSLAVYSPKDKLTAHACAAILREKLHFADAAVSVYTGLGGSSTKSYVAITLVEPSDSALIHYKPAYRDSLPTRAEWLPAWTTFRSSNELVQRAIQTPSFFDRQLSAADSATFARIEPVHALLAANHDARAFDLAVRTLDEDGSVSNRTIALLILASFAERDAAWWAIADALRDPQSGVVNATAAQLLGMLTRRSPRSVDWGPAADRLRYVIDGTNLFGIDALMTALSKTMVSPSLSNILLGDGGTIVRAKLHSGDVSAKSAATALLAQLSGLPAESDVSAFERWMRELGPRVSGF